jgi:hypothetical protein
MKKLILPLLLFCVTINKAQTAGPTAPATLTNTGTGIAWSISSNIQANTLGNTATPFLQGTNFGFAVPGTATITGIVLKSAQYTSNSPHNDTIVELLKNLVPNGQNKNMPGNMPIAGQLTYGSNTDLWGTTWTPSDVNNINFGFHFKVYNPLVSQNMILFVGQFSVTVYYTTITGLARQETKVIDMLNAYSSNDQVIIKNNSDADLNQSTISISTILGQKIFSQKVTLERSNSDIRINMPEHPKGIYILSIDKENLHYAKKLYID